MIRNKFKSNTDNERSQDKYSNMQVHNEPVKEQDLKVSEHSSDSSDGKLYRNIDIEKYEKIKEERMRKTKPTKKYGSQKMIT